MKMPFARPEKTSKNSGSGVVVRQAGGHALVLVLCLAAACLITMAATLSRTANDSMLNARNNQYQASIYAAEAATEKALARVQADFIAGNLTSVTNSIYLGTYHTSIPKSSEDAYWGNYQFTDGMGHSGSNFIGCMFSQGWGALRSQYAGLSGWTNHLYIVSNAKQLNTPYNIVTAVQQDIELDLIPVFQFAIFYNSLLEFTWCATMTVNGRTHANGNMYTGSQWQLTFSSNSIVDVTGQVLSPAWGGHVVSDYTDPAVYKVPYTTNSNSLNLPIGTTNVHEIINMPPAGGDTNQSLAQQRYYDKAGVVLLVSNSTITAIYKSSMYDTASNVVTAAYYPTNTYFSNYVQISNNFPFLNVTNYWPSAGYSTNPAAVTDQREASAVLKLTDIDVGILKTWLVTNTTVKNKFPSTANVYPSATNAPNILYVADNRSYGSGQLTAVRLKNASIIPTNLFTFTGTNAPSGFTVATPNPLYVWGNYNCPNPADLGKSNAPSSYPASLISDSLTILSTNWVDSQSSKLVSDSTKNKAGDTTVNAAILTGVVYSTASDSSHFSGGVHNLPRLLEDWQKSSSASTAAKLTINTSIVNLFSSTRATNLFKNPASPYGGTGGYYWAPTRQFSFDQNFLSYYKQPPGTPMLSYAIRSKWSTPKPGTTNYAGF